MHLGCYTFLLHQPTTQLCLMCLFGDLYYVWLEMRPMLCMYVFGAWYYVWLEMRPMLCLYVFGT